MSVIYCEEKISGSREYVQCEHIKKKVCKCIKRGHKGFVPIGNSGYPWAEGLHTGMAKKIRGQKLPFYVFFFKNTFYLF